MKKIPFYENLPTDTHCFQAALKMALKYYFPERNFSFEELDTHTYHKEGMWTWHSAAFLFLADLGISVLSIENFDFRQFAKWGEEYLTMLWGKEVFEKQKNFSDFTREQQLARTLVAKDVFSQKEGSDTKHFSIKESITKIQTTKKPLVEHYRQSATIEDAIKLFEEQFIVLVALNPFVLRNEGGYASHIVVLTDINEKMVTFHDPGLPPQKNKIVSKKHFEQAMYYPDRSAGSLIALRVSDYIS